MTKTAFVSDYALFVQHWGILVGLAGLFMIVVAFRDSWRTPVLTYTAIGKTSFILLCIAGAGRPYAAAFALPAVMDALVVLYVVAYFWATSSPALVTPVPARGDGT